LKKKNDQVKEIDAIKKGGHWGEWGVHFSS